MNNASERIARTSVASIYVHYVAKAERRNRSKAEVDEIICWLTGYSQDELERVLEDKVAFGEFFAQAPGMNPARSLITGVVCGVRVEDIEDPFMREVRYLDKLIEELNKTRPLSKIMRTSAAA